MPGNPTPALLVDLYELTMGESYLAQGLAERPATFELFCRTLPRGWGYLLAAGIEDALAALEGLRFAGGDLAFLESTGLFGAAFLERLSRAPLLRRRARAAARARRSSRASRCSR